MATRNPSGLTNARIVKREDLSSRVWKLWLEPHQPFAFKPGQYCTIGAGGLERPYSIVSAPHEALLELFLKLIPEPEGVLTPILHTMGEGSTLTLRPRAKGIFTLDPTRPRHLMVATGTGIAPFISMVRDYLFHLPERDPLEYHLLHGADYRPELGYEQELAELAQRHPWIHYTPTLGLPLDPSNHGCSGFTGWVSPLLDEYVPQHGLEPASTMGYVCGHPGMIADARARLEPLGHQVKEERYWKD